MTREQVAAALLSVMLLGGCATAPLAPAALQPSANEPYRLDSGDKVKVSVFEQDALTGTYAINKTGSLAMPLIGDVPVRGQTTHELEAALEGRLRDGFLRDPDVTVEVETYRPFFIMGEVTQGGQYAYLPGMTVQKAVASAGGFTPRAEKRSVDLTRQANGRAVTQRVSPLEAIQPGDTIDVRERWF